MAVELRKTVSINRINLDLENPRHDKFSSQDDCIRYLCEKENILILAKDIAKEGLNPLEYIGVIREGSASYFAAEGNRRVCALKLINDPDLAPAGLRKEFRKLNQNPRKITSIEVRIFENREEVRIWLDRIHAGYDDGRGRRQWTSEQKSRNSKYSKNDLALSIIDLMENYGLLSKNQRNGKLSTVQRYFSNPVIRNTFGIAGSSKDDLTTTLSYESFHFSLQILAESLIDNTINTRKNSKEIIKFSTKLMENSEYSNNRQEPWLLFEYYRSEKPKATVKTVSDSSQDADNPAITATVATPDSPPDTPTASAESSEGDTDSKAYSFPHKSKGISVTPPVKPKYILGLEEIQKAIKEIPSYKLENIYFSMCSISLKEHTPLLTVAAWMFIETLTALNGRNEKTDFVSFLSVQRMDKDFDLGAKDKTKGITEALKRISESGNSTKHNKTSAHFNSESLFNDFETLSPLILALAKGAKGKS